MSSDANPCDPWISSFPFDPQTFDFETIPDGQGVFLLKTEGEPYVNRSANLRRRLTRLLQAEQDEKRLNLRGVTRVIRFRTTGSVFESSVLLWR